MKLSKSQTVLPTLNQFARRLLEKYGEPIGAGRNRVVWKMRGSHVIKLPRCDSGITDNDWEGSVSDPGFTARTRLIYIHDIPIVVMEYVEDVTLAQISEHLGLPAGDIGWAGCFDSGQVGFNKSGTLLAYDWGIK
jgi:hypothetical protein